MLASSELVSAQKDVDIVDVFFKQQFFVGRIADKDDCLVELLSEIVARPRGIALNDLDLVGLLEREREAHTDVAAAGDDDAPYRVLKTYASHS